MWCYTYWELIVCLHHHRIQWNYRQRNRRKNRHGNTMYIVQVRCCCVHNTLNRFAHAMCKKQSKTTDADERKHLVSNWISHLVLSLIRIGWVRSDHECDVPKLSSQLKRTHAKWNESNDGMDNDEKCISKRSTSIWYVPLEIDVILIGFFFVMLFHLA